MRPSITPSSILQKSAQQRNEKKQVTIDFIHHTLMKYYGWISLQEFRELPINAVMKLFDQCQKEESVSFNRFCAQIQTMSKYKPQDHIKDYVNMG